MFDRCLNSIGWHDDGDRHGRCTWCGKRVQSPVPSPVPRVAVSQLSSAYAYFYDPDYGTAENERDAYQP